MNTRLLFIAALALAYLVPTVANAADINVRLANAPTTGNLVFQVYDAADTFGDLRNPANEITLPARGDGDYVLRDVADGEIAVLVYHDENGNSVLDKNFIGIPRELLAISRGYRPKGPPSFARASVSTVVDQVTTVDIEFYRVLGDRGRVGLGIGAITRSSPYVGSTRDVTRVIPAVTYIGDRLQWLGPTLRYGVIGSDNLRLALAADYRVGAYEEADSPFLTGLGDREDALMVGFALQYEIAEGFEAELLYQHDALDRIGGSIATARLSRGIPWGTATFVPQLAWNWASADIGNHDFGVPSTAATPERPAYRLGDTSSFEVGIGALFELTEDWRIVVNVAAEKLSSDVTRSPIVDDDIVVKGLAVVSYVF